MKNIFDYTFYRIAKFYFKRDGSDSITALLTLTLIMFLYFLNIFLAFFELLKIDIIGMSTIFEKVTILIIIFFIYLFNKKKYNRRYLALRDKWINEEKNKKRINGFFVIFFILSPLLLLVFIASLFGRTNF